MLRSFKPVSHIHDFYCRLWQDHFRIEFVKSISKIPLIQIWKSIFLIRTTIIYCSGSAKIRSFLGKYIPIIPFSLLFYKMWSNRAQTVTMQWTDADGRYHLENCHFIRDDLHWKRLYICKKFCNCWTLTWVSLSNFVVIRGVFRNGFFKDSSQSTRSECNMDIIGRKTATAFFFL